MIIKVLYCPEARGRYYFQITISIYLFLLLRNKLIISELKKKSELEKGRNVGQVSPCPALAAHLPEVLLLMMIPSENIQRFDVLMND